MLKPYRLNFTLASLAPTALVLGAVALAGCHQTPFPGAHADSDRAPQMTPTFLSADDAVTGVKTSSLELISQKLAAIQNTALVNDQARIQVLNRLVVTATDLAKSKGLGHIKTMNSLRKVVKYFIFSDYFFNFIRTDRNSPLIDEVLNLTISPEPGSLRTDTGYDDDPFGTVLADNLDVIQQSVRELLAAAELPEDVRLALRPLIARVGYVFGLAQGQGDRPIPHSEGTKLCAELDALYPVMDRLNGSQQLFQRAQDIRGTNEFLKDFLQVDEINRQPK